MRVKVNEPSLPVRLLKSLSHGALFRCAYQDAGAWFIRMDEADFADIIKDTCTPCCEVKTGDLIWLAHGTPCILEDTARIEIGDEE